MSSKIWNNLGPQIAGLASPETMEKLNQLNDLTQQHEREREAAKKQVNVTSPNRRPTTSSKRRPIPANSGVLDLSSEQLDALLIASTTNENAKKVVTLYQAAKSGDASAQRILGNALLSGGLGLKKDEPRAARWLRSAADSGDSIAVKLLENTPDLAPPTDDATSGLSGDWHLPDGSRIEIVGKGPQYKSTTFNRLGEKVETAVVTKKGQKVTFMATNIHTGKMRYEFIQTELDEMRYDLDANLETILKMVGLTKAAFSIPGVRDKVTQALAAQVLTRVR